LTLPPAQTVYLQVFIAVLLTINPPSTIIRPPHKSKQILVVPQFEGFFHSPGFYAWEKEEGLVLKSPLMGL
jgi:hypothetical protein